MACKGSGVQIPSAPLLIMKKFLKLTVFASSFAIATSIASADQFIRMVSGPSGGSWYPLGAKIMQVMQDKIKGTATSNTSGGGISNVMSVDGGDAEFGFTYAHTVAHSVHSANVCFLELATTLLFRSSRETLC